MSEPAWVGALDAELRAAGSPERAVGEKRYLKSDLEFYGTTVWTIRSTVTAHWRATGGLDHDELIAAAEALWARPVHERRMAAVVLLECGADRLGPRDVPLLERLIRESRTWALVDGLAGDVLGALVRARPAEVRTVLDGWITDPDFWVRRSALLAELPSVRAGGELGPFLARADQVLDETEFFVRKAIGWVLREAGKRHPDEVAAWLGPRITRASGVTVREAVKYLRPDDAAALLSAYGAARPRGGRRASG